MTKEFSIKELKNQTFNKIDSHGLLSEGDKKSMKKFTEWFISLPKEEHQKDIIRLRNDFFEFEKKLNNNVLNERPLIKNKIKPA